VLLTRKHLRHAVGWHLVRGLPVYVEAAFLNLLADLVLVDVDLLKLSAQFVLLFCNYANSLLIVTLNNRRLIKL
jgi:hypothetical protein